MSESIRLNWFVYRCHGKSDLDARRDKTYTLKQATTQELLTGKTRLAWR